VRPLPLRVHHLQVQLDASSFTLASLSHWLLVHVALHHGPTIMQRRRLKANMATV
jgi:hypothetical protein